MILYRIARARYANDLSGKGGVISSARWHDHMPVIYTSLSSSTAILEKFVQVRPEEVHHDLKMVAIEVPDTVSQEKIRSAQLRPDWNTYPAPEYLRKIGNSWLAGMSALLLHVPSAIDPIAYNVLINPLHAEIIELKILNVQDFSFNGRMLKR